MIDIVPYTAEWPDEFVRLGRQLRRNLDDLALRIDHIGSTAVPGLAAKDVIDIQVTARELTPGLERALELAGYRRVERITRDHLPPGCPDRPEEWLKWLFKPPATQRPANVHVRVRGRANQRYAILFRDYLRAWPAIAQAYARLKTELVKHHPEDDMAAYCDIKDPACDIVRAGAEIWAASTAWKAGPTDC